jgi:hypothetical protein
VFLVTEFFDIAQAPFLACFLVILNVYIEGDILGSGLQTPQEGSNTTCADWCKDYHFLLALSLKFIYSGILYTLNFDIANRLS